MPAPSEVVSKQFCLRHPSTRIAADADSTPTAVFVHNGVDTAHPCTVTKITTGVYKVHVSIPSTYNDGDEIEARITATVNGLTQLTIISLGEIESR